MSCFTTDSLNPGERKGPVIPVIVLLFLNDHVINNYHYYYYDYDDCYPPLLLLLYIIEWFYFFGWTWFVSYWSIFDLKLSSQRDYSDMHPCFYVTSCPAPCKSCFGPSRAAGLFMTPTDSFYPDFSEIQFPEDGGHLGFSVDHGFHNLAGSSHTWRTTAVESHALLTVHVCSVLYLCMDYAR